MVGAAPDLWVVPQPSGNEHFVVRGGVGGIAFSLEELLGGAEKLDLLAEQLEDSERELQSIRTALWDLRNDPWNTGAAALDSVDSALGALYAVRVSFQVLGSGVRRSMLDYQAAEQKAALLRAVGLGPEPGTGSAFFQWPPGLDQVESTLGTAPLTAGLLLGIAPGKFAALIAADLVLGRRFGAIRPLVAAIADAHPQLAPRPISAEAGAPQVMTLVPTPAGLLKRVQLLEDLPDPTVEVVRLAGSGSGSPAYVVVIPGTQNSAPLGGSNPFDVAGIAEALGFGSPETTAAVHAALTEAGAVAGDPVVAVGYSQGGIHAMNLAQNDDFLADFDLRYVLTAGSPVGDVQLRPGVESLSLEHRQDWVPGSDGTPNRDARNQVTVTLTDPVATPAGQGLGLGPGHRLDSYVAGAEKVDQSQDPSLVASRGALTGILGTGGTATAVRFTMTRAPATSMAGGASPNVPPRAAATSLGTDGGKAGPAEKGGEDSADRQKQERMRMGRR